MTIDTIYQMVQIERWIINMALALCFVTQFSKLCWAKGELELWGNLILPLIHLTDFMTTGRSYCTAWGLVACVGILKTLLRPLWLYDQARGLAALWRVVIQHVVWHTCDWTIKSIPSEMFVSVADHKRNICLFAFNEPAQESEAVNGDSFARGCKTVVLGKKTKQNPPPKHLLLKNKINICTRTATTARPATWRQHSEQWASNPSWHGHKNKPVTGNVVFPARVSRLHSFRKSKVTGIWVMTIDAGKGEGEDETIQISTLTDV